MAVASRLGMMIVLLGIVSLVTFGLTLMIPRDPAFTLLGDGATADQVAAVRAALDLDDPASQRYLSWLGGVLHGDLGTSLFSAYPVSEAIGQRLPITISLVLLSLLVSVGLGMFLGVVAAVRPGGLLDRTVLLFSSMGIALTNFWLGLLLVGFIASEAGLLPVGGYVPLGESPSAWLTHLILPVLTLAAGGVAEIARQTRAGMVDVLQRDFIRAPRRSDQAAGAPSACSPHAGLRTR